MMHGVLALPMRPLVLQKAAEMKKYDKISTRAEAGRQVQQLRICGEQSNEGIKQACRSGRHVASGYTRSHSAFDVLSL